MAYSRTNWVAHETKATAERMNNIEEGILANEEAAAAGVKYAADQSLTDAQKARARANIGAGSATDVDNLRSAVQLDEKYALLLHDEIPGTTQTVAFDSSGNVSTIAHTDGNNVAVRTEAFTFATNSITEVRTLNTGETLTIVTNTTTLATTVTYAAAA